MSNYNFLMESRLSAEQFQLVNELSRIAAGQGLNLYLVGGAVRDLTYGQQVIRDLDFAVEGNPEKLLQRLGSRRAETARSHRTPSGGSETSRLHFELIHFDARRMAGTIRCAGGTQAELAMCRQDSSAPESRHTRVTPATIFEDLRSRDFSVNAMAISLHPHSRGLLLDPTNGAADIESHELRALHSRSFSEDPTRIYRLFRLGLRLNFKPEERTRARVESALQNRFWEQLDPAQQGRELHAILAEENPGRFLRLFADRKLLAGLDKKLASARIAFDKFNKVQSVARTVPGADPVLLNFYCLAQAVGSGERVRLAKKILGDQKTIKAALGLERDARVLARTLTSSKAGLPSNVYAMLSGQPLILLLFLLVNNPQQKIQSRIKSYLFKAPQIRAGLPRAELQAMGVNPGPEFDRIVGRLFLDQLDGKVKTHQQTTKRLKELAGIEDAPQIAKKNAPKDHGKNKKR